MNERLLVLGAAAAVAASVALVGCGSQVAHTATGPIQVSPSQSERAVSPPPDTSMPTTGVTQQAITGPVVVSGQDRVLTVLTLTGGCKTVKLLSQEASTAVTLTLETTDNHKPGQMCPDFLKQTHVSTTLDAPLGTRQLIDGVTGKEVPTGV